MCVTTGTYDTDRPSRLVVLIVGRDPQYRDDLRQLLSVGATVPYTMIEVEPGAMGATGALRLDGSLPNCVLIDRAVSEASPSELLTGFLGRDGLTFTPVVVLDDVLDSKTARLVFRAGAQDYISRVGLTTSELTRVIENAVDRWNVDREQRAHEAEVREDEHRFRQIFAGVAVGIARMSLDGQLIEVNDAFCRIQGYPREEVLGLTFDQITHPADRDTEQTLLHQLVTGEIPAFTMEKRTLRKDGTTIWVNHTVSLDCRLDGTFRAFISVVQDITGKKQAEDQVFQAKQMLRLVLDTVPNGVFWKDRNSRHLGCNRVIAQALGFDSPDQVIGLADADLPSVTPEQAAVFTSTDLKVMETGRPFYVSEQLTKPDGTTIWLNTVKLPFHDTDGQLIGVIGTWEDVTERRRMEQQLSDTNSRLNALLNALPVGVCFSEDPTCERITGNRAVLSQFSVRPEDNISVSAADPTVPGRQFRFFQGGRRIKDSEMPMQRAVAENRVIAPMELEVLLPDGRRWFAEASAAPIHDDRGNVIAGVAVTVDITDRKRTELKLQESQSRLNAALQSMTDAVFISDTEGRFVEFNEAFATYHKFASKDECVQTFAEFPALFDVYFPNGAVVPLEQWAVPRALRGEIGTNNEYRLRRKDTGETWIGSYNFAPIRDESGTVVGCVIVGRDVTAQKNAEAELRESEERLRLTLKSGAMGTFEVDLQEGENIWNDVEFELFGLKPGDLPASAETFSRHIHPEDARNVKRQWESALRTGSLDSEFRIIRADGQVRWLAGKGSYLCVSERNSNSCELQKKRFLGVNYDITEQKLAEQQVRAMNADLEERVARRTAQLAEANEELEAFSYSVSHDLRAPVRAIDGFSRILLEDFHDRFPEEAQDFLHEVSVNAKKMGQLIDDLLVFSRLTRQSVNKTTVSVDELVRQCVADLSRGRSVEFRVSPDLPPCFADPALLKQVWLNLIDNALKYSGLRERPVIEIGATTGNRESVYFIKDNGVGFDMRYADKLFGVFQRLHRQEDFDGTGVGLAIVQRVIHRHEGRVWADAQLDNGATFFFSLPVQGAAKCKN